MDQVEVFGDQGVVRSLAANLSGESHSLINQYVTAKEYLTGKYLLLFNP